MYFQHPYLLSLLVVPFCLGMWSLFKHGTAISSPVADESLGRQPLTVGLLKLGKILPSLLLACVVVLLARPMTKLDVVGRTPVKATNIEILLNASRSMLSRSEIGYHCRYCASKVAIQKFVEMRQGNTMGISIFGSRHLDLVPLTADLNCVVQAISRTFPDYIAGEIAYEKNFAEGINGSVDKLVEKAESGSEQVLILVTDGESDKLGREEDDLRRLLVENNITLYVVMIADGNNSPVLARLAEGTPGGKLLKCRDAMGFFEIMHHIDRMKKIVYQDKIPKPVDDNNQFLNLLVGFASFLAVLLATPFRPTPW